MKHIVKHGNNVLRFICRECRCIYECDKDDYSKEIEYSQKTGEPLALHYYSICPECDLLNAITKTPPM